MATPQDKVSRYPVVTLSLLAFAFVVGQSPALCELLVYDRSKILSGEIWRIFTCHWVHFSASHLLYNGIALVILGCLAEMQFPTYKWLCAIAPGAIGLGLLVTEPRMAIYGGLSGFVTAIPVFIALQQLRDHCAPRWLPIALLSGVFAKICAELLISGPVFVTTGEIETIGCTSSHLLGAATGVVCWVHPRTVLDDGRVIALR